MTLKVKGYRWLVIFIINKERTMGFWNKITTFLGYEDIRARNDIGQYIADDKSTPDIDESKERVYKSRGKKKPTVKKTSTK